jgi:septal ring factor EnvC (AmiA/AmiB activator)
VLFLGENFLEKRCKPLNCLQKYYQQLNEIKAFINENLPLPRVNLIEENRNLKRENLLLKKKKEELLEREEELTHALAKEGKTNQALANSLEEFESFKKGLVWKLLNIYREFKKSIKGLFKSTSEN